MEDEEEYQAGTPIYPREVHVITFYGKPLVVVVLPDGQPAVSIRSLCDNMELERKAQVRRIQRTEVLAPDFRQNVMIDLGTGGGPQPSQVLILRSLSYWLIGIEVKRVREDLREGVLRYQREALDVLYQWAAQRSLSLLAPTSPVVESLPLPTTTAIVQTGPGEAILAPIDDPGPEANHSDKAKYHETMSVWHQLQANQHAQAWRDEVDARVEDQETRLEAKEALTNLIPEILNRLGPARVTKEQQQAIRNMVKRLTELTGVDYQKVYWELAQAFQVPRYDELRESDYSAVEKWFQRRIEAATKKEGR